MMKKMKLTLDEMKKATTNTLDKKEVKDIKGGSDIIGTADIEFT